jgi:putative oxidoreductase
MTALPFDFVLDARSAVRIVCGAFFLPHTIAKLRNIDRASVLFDNVGFRPPRPFVVLTTMMELIAAFGLISGLYPRVAAVVAATVLLGAAYAIARNHTLMWRCGLSAVSRGGGNMLSLS